jgi:hypothetical protein
VELRNLDICSASGRKDIEDKYDKNYKIGNPQSIFIGEEILKLKPYYLISEAIMAAKAKSDINIIAKHRWTEYNLKIEKNGEYHIRGNIRIDGERFHIAEINTVWGILISDTGFVRQDAIYSIYDEMVFYPSVITMKSLETTSFFLFQKAIKPDVKREESMDNNWELLYSGINDVALNAIYREYTHDDLIRPAFTQQISYSRDSKQIRFKGFLIRIDAATNEKLTYSIIEDDL